MVFNDIPEPFYEISVSKAQAREICEYEIAQTDKTIEELKNRMQTLKAYRATLVKKLKEI